MGIEMAEMVQIKFPKSTIEEPTPAMRWLRKHHPEGPLVLQQVWKIVGYDEDGKPCSVNSEWRDVPTAYDF